MTKYFLLVFGLFLSFSLFAQKNSKKEKWDYLVSNDNDTIRGKFKKSFMGQLRFEDKEGGLYELDPLLYKSYYDAGEKKTYTKIIIDQKPYWFTKIIDGRISVYEQTYNTTLANGSFMTIRRWMAQKDGGQPVAVISSGLNVSTIAERQNLEYLVRDNPVIFSELQKTVNYTFGKAKNFIQVYNTAAATVVDPQP